MEIDKNAPHDEVAYSITIIPPGAGQSWQVITDQITCKADSDITAGGYSLFEVTIPPQSELPLHRHNQEDEAYYILEGELLIQSVDETFTAITGSFVYIPKGTLNRHRNLGSTPVRALVITTPAGMENLFDELGTPITADRTLLPTVRVMDADTVTAIARKYHLEIPSLLE